MVSWKRELIVFRTPGQWMYASPVVGFILIEFQESGCMPIQIFQKLVAVCQGMKINYFASLIKILTTRLNSPGIISD